MKKTLSVLLSASMALGLSLAGFNNGFALKISDKAKPNYDYLRQKQIMQKNLRDANFNEVITRDEFTQLLVNYVLSNKNDDVNKYTNSRYVDMTKSSNADNYKQINYAIENGIISGFSDNTFKGKIPIERGDAVIAAYNADKLIKNTSYAKTAKFKDYKYFQGLRKEAISYMASKNYITGYTNGYFNQKGKLTRSEAIEIVANMVKSAKSNIRQDAYNFIKTDAYYTSSDYEYILNNKPSELKLKKDEIMQAVYDTDKNYRIRLYNEFTNNNPYKVTIGKTSPNLIFEKDMSVYMLGTEAKKLSDGSFERRVFFAQLDTNRSPVGIFETKTGSWYTLK